MDEVADCCIKAYERQGKKGKPPPHQWSVFAAVVLKSESSTGGAARYQTVAMGTGSKCLGSNSLSKDGTALHDSHAEVLARRSFLRYLYNQVQLVAKGGDSSIFSAPCDDRGLGLKPGVSFGLYVSQAPCLLVTAEIACHDFFVQGGDASIFRTTTESTAAGHKHASDDAIGNECKRLKEDAETSKEDTHRTGSKPVPTATPDPLLPGPLYHALGVLRTKPGRGDPTRSMSCTDKILKWSVVGCQGALLSHFIQPIKLAFIVISELFDQEACIRAWHQRLPADSSPIEIYGTSHVFPLSKMSLEKAGGSPIPCASSSGWFLEDQAWVLDATVLGMKQGYSANSKKPPKDITAGWSALCKARMFRMFSETRVAFNRAFPHMTALPEFQEVDNSKEGTATQQDPSTSQVEESQSHAIPFPSYSQCKRMSRSYSEALLKFHEAVPGWLGNDQKCDDFALK